MQKEIDNVIPCEREVSSSSSSKAFSPLANKLLTLWAHGTLSVVMIREIAHLAMLDGAQHPDLYGIAKTGNFGQQHGNVHRDLMHEFARNICIEKHQCATNFIDPKSSSKEEVQAHMYLPHVLFSNLAKGYPTKFNELFIGNALEQFWEYALEKEDARIEKHPLLKVYPNWKQTTIPMFIHGDGVELQEMDQFMVWSWGPLLCQACSLETNMLIGAIPKSCTSEETWAPLMELLVWSFQALLMGVHPTVDHLGRPFGKRVLRLTLRKGNN